MSNYPIGCHNAPWDAPEMEENTIGMNATCTLFAYSKVTTWDAITEYDEDEDGTAAYLDTTNVQADVDFQNQHFTPLQLFNALKTMCEDKLKIATDKQEIHTLQKLIADCNLWQEESFEVEIDE